MDILRIFHEKPWHVLLISSLVFTSTLTYLITSDIFRADARTKLDVCLFHLRQNQAAAYRRHSLVSPNQSCFNSNYLNRLRLRQKLPFGPPPSGPYSNSKCPYGNASILILSPFEEFPGHFSRFLGNLMSLTYPHCLLRIAIGIDRSLDRSVPVFQQHVKKLLHKFRSLEVHPVSVIDSNADKLPKFADQHRKDVLRRLRLAKVRNALLFSALRDEKYVFWMDSDIREVPPDILQTLISAQVPVVVPSYLYRKSPSEFGVYDRNSWRETEASRKFLESQDSNFLMLEGYGNKTLRSYLPDLANEGSLVKLDGVGACCLLVEANVHKQGAVFPFYLVKNHIETEGFAQLAKLLGYQVYGMPRVNVIH